MAKQITILQPQRMRMPVYTPWHIHFSRYLGRPLTPVEISVISPLEKARVNRNSSPVFILDPPGIDSSWILLRYQEYRLQGLPDAQGALFIPGKDRHRYPQAKLLPSNIRLITHRCVDAVRGTSPYCTLLLNVERYCTSSPFHSCTDRWRRLLCSILPTHNSRGFIIIHASAAKAESPSGSRHIAISAAITRLIPFRSVSAVKRQHHLPVVVALPSMPDTPLTEEISAILAEVYYPPPHQAGRYAVLRSPKLNRTARAH